MQQTFKEFLIEARRNPELNPKIDTLDQLISIFQSHSREYDSIFVTFTEFNKLGANPQSKFHTPLGIYAYPLSYVIKQKLNVPYQSNARYIQVFKLLSFDNIWELQDPSQVKVIKQKISKVYDKVNGNTPNLLWYSLYQDFNNPFNQSNNNDDNEGLRVRKILTSAGISGVIDYNGGIIHENEPTQAVFFNTKILYPIKTIDSKSQ